MSDFEPGELIVSSKPYAYVLSNEFRGLICDYCFKKNDNLKRCSQCSFLYFCDRNCQAKSWKEHKVECKFLKKSAELGPAPSLRLISLIIFKVKKYGQDEPFEKVYNRKVTFGTLMSHIKELRQDKRRCEIMMALYTTLKQYIGPNNVPPLNDFYEIFGKMCVNSFSICDGEMAPIGSGLYLGASIFDHSCDPDAVAIFDGIDLNIRAIRNIPHRDANKVYISYISSLELKEKKKKDLLEQYYFLCNCSSCSSSNHEKMKTKLLEDTIESKQEAHRCNAELERIKKMVKDKEDPQSIYKACEELLRIENKFLADTNIIKIKTLEIAFDACITLQKWTDALVFGNCLDEPLRLYFGNNHPQLGIHLFKIGKILHYQEMSRVAVPKLIEAENILKITHGEKHPLTKELSSLLQEAKFASLSF